MAQVIYNVFVHHTHEKKQTLISVCTSDTTALKNINQYCEANDLKTLAELEKDQLLTIGNTIGYDGNVEFSIAEQQVNQLIPE